MPNRWPVSWITAEPEASRPSLRNLSQSQDLGNLAREIGAKTVPIYTMETSENGKGYLERMKENLAHIEESLR